jgi:hypothetical protein
MPQRRFTVLVLAAVAVATLAACASSGGSKNDATATVDGDAVAVGAAPVPGGGAGSLGDAVAAAAAAPGEAANAFCSIDRRALESAVEAYALLNGGPPASQQELLDAQMIRELSERFEVGAGGAVTPAHSGPCS